MQLLPFDSECAATALRHQATLVTRNVREFSRMPGLQWLNWHQN
jgi:tRNA(fMet)-specific endonuclease VapC